MPLIFSASHGIEFRATDARQRTQQGAVVCQEWKGPGSVARPDMYFGGDDLAGAGDLKRLIWFSFACFGAGTPKLDNFPGNPNILDARQIASETFQAAMPGALLSQEAGPALAFIGHVERAWATSFIFGTATSQSKDFRECLSRIMHGRRLGYALSVFSGRYASLSTLLASEIIRVLQAKRALTHKESWSVVRFWTAAMDARNFVLLGDPAARLRVTY